MKTLRTVLVAVLMVGALSVAAYGAGLALRSQEPSAAGDERTSPRSSPQPSETSLPARRTVPGQDLRAEFRLEPGDRGVKVRELQSRLFQLAWFPELTTGRYDPATRDGRARASRRSAAWRPPASPTSGRGSG